MNGFKSVFQILDVDFNARRTDYHIIELNNIKIGRVYPGLLDYIDQNIIIEISPINFLKLGSYALEGPIGLGHYYPQYDSFTINTYSITPRILLRTDTFSDGFLFISRFRDEYKRRQVFIRSDFKSSIIEPNIINSIWLHELSNFTPNGLIDINLLNNNRHEDGTQDTHSFINAYTFLHNMHGEVTIYYSDKDTLGNPAGLNADYVGSGTSGIDPRFNIPTLDPQ
jgi:hypothetical protein